jgi:hypothetical protein
MATSIDSMLQSLDGYTEDAAGALPKATKSK